MNTINNIDFDILTIVHRIWIEGKKKQGGLDKILDYYAKQKKKRILLAEHPYYNQGELTLTLRAPQGEKIILKRGLTNVPAWINWVKEAKFNLRLARKITGPKILFSADPLSALPGLWPGNKKFAFRYFHCVDYADRRFRNPILNFIYHFLLKKILRDFDLIGAVSEKTKEKFSALGCPAEKIFLTPNSPPFAKIDLTGKEENSIVCMGGDVIGKYRYEDVVEIVKMVQKKIPQIKCYIIGGLQYQDYARKIQSEIKTYGLENNFIFTGYLQSEQIETILKKAKIGISFYAEEERYYMKYGDPLKIREYALYGIPALTDGKTALDLEVEKKQVGFIVKNNAEAEQKIILLLNNDQIYQKFSRNAVSWAEKNDKQKILDCLYQKIFRDKI